MESCCSMATVSFYFCIGQSFLAGFILVLNDWNKILFLSVFWYGFW
jgi:hypothetical protein